MIRKYLKCTQRESADFPSVEFWCIGTSCVYSPYNSCRLALSDANRALNQEGKNFTALVAKAEALYTLHMFEEALVLFSRLRRRRRAFKQEREEFESV